MLHIFLILFMICLGLGEIIRSCLAISEVILVISDVVLDNFLKFGKTSAKIILKNGFG